MRSLLLVGGAVAFLILFMRQAAGRLAPRVAIAPIVFLATRWPVLATWAVGALYWLFVLVTGMQAKGLDTPDHYALAAGVSILCGGGMAVMLVGPVFFLARAFASAPTLALASDETLLAERLANHFLGGEARGGKLLITSKRLAFRPHRFNVQLDTWSLPLVDVEHTECEGSRLLLVYASGHLEPSWLVVSSPSVLKEDLAKLLSTPEAARREFKFGAAPAPPRGLQF